MIRSMTGYGLASAENDKYTVKTEIRSLNGKFLEINMRMPRFLQEKDFQMRSEFGKQIERGSVTISINCTAKPGGGNAHMIDMQLAEAYYTQVKALGGKLGLKDENSLSTIVNLPDVVISNDEELTEDDWQLVLATLRKSFAQFEEFRKTEGASIRDAFVASVKAIEKGIETVEALEPERNSNIKTKLETGLGKISDMENLDKSRLEQELLYYIEKLDITEEKSRLRQHCKFFRDTIDGQSNGKKLNFIAQEMGREINTMGSKANHFGIQQAVVLMKEELEKIKEQVNNVL